MDTPQLEFPEWWEDWLQKGHEREEFHAALERLFRFVDLLPPKKRRAFASELTDLACRQGKAWHIALAALERLAERDDFKRLSLVATAMPAVHPPQPLVDYRIGVLRVLAKDTSGEFLGAVDAYCDGEVDAWFTSRGRCGRIIRNGLQRATRAISLRHLSRGGPGRQSFKHS